MGEGESHKDLHFLRKKGFFCRLTTLHSATHSVQDVTQAFHKCLLDSARYIIDLYNKRV